MNEKTDPTQRPPGPYMTRALELAARAEGFVSPRPPVGCVIVAGDEVVGQEVVGEGFTRLKPGPHAEDDALASAGSRAKSATAYVTLEPCNTPRSKPASCAELLIAAGVSRVVAAVTDPHPDVDGRGFEMLRRAGIEVEIGEGHDRALELIEPFALWATSGRPFVTLKLAASLDGKIAAPDGTSRWISGEASRAEVHELRRKVDAICVGAKTVVADDPLLTYRGERPASQPLRVVLDPGGRIPASAKVFNDDAPSLRITRDDVGAGDGGVDIEKTLELLAARGVCHLLVEGGPTVAASFIAAGLVDRFVLYLAPKVIGGDAPGLFSSGVKSLSDAWGLEIESVERVGEDIKVISRPARPRKAA